MVVVVVIPTFQSCQMVEEEKGERRGGGEFEAVGVCKNGAEASGSVDIKPPGTFRGPADDIGGCSFRKRNRPAASSAAWPCLWTGAHGIHTGYRVCEDERLWPSMPWISLGDQRKTKIGAFTLRSRPL